MDSIRTPLTTEQPLESPAYSLEQNKARAIVPKILLFMLLGGIFYLGVLANLALLSLNSSQEIIAKSIGMGIIFITIIIGIFLAIQKSKRTYQFYRTKLVFGKKEVNYSQISNTTPSKNMFDKAFRTYSIKLTDGLSLKHISDQIEMRGYLQKLIAYSEKSS